MSADASMISHNTVLNESIAHQNIADKVLQPLESNPSEVKQAIDKQL